MTVKIVLRDPEITKGCRFAVCGKHSNSIRAETKPKSGGQNNLVMDWKVFLLLASVLLSLYLEYDQHIRKLLLFSNLEQPPTWAPIGLFVEKQNVSSSRLTVVKSFHFFASDDH